MPFQQILLDHATNQGGGAIRRVLSIRIRSDMMSRGDQGGALFRANHEGPGKHLDG